ncbi:MAG: class I SAM-dependent methyltransferase [Micropruina sp.]|nr:class I SAM-dependent methyltransferase [Micropruina sp.]
MNNNPLEEYFRENHGRRIHKWIHYFDIYHRHFQRFRGQPVSILEFGVQHGGSMQMWRDYFGPSARIHGVDIDPRCAAVGNPKDTIFIGDQEDRDFLRSVVDEIGSIDIVIEDGGHRMGQQVATFEEVYPRMSADGVFLIEDLHTSYWPNYGGGYRAPQSFMEYAKSLTDSLNAWHSRNPELEVSDFTRTTKSMHFYDSIVVFERGPVSRPYDEMCGQPSF